MGEDGDDDEMLQGDVTCDGDENFIRLVGGACEEVEGEGVWGCEEAEAFTSGAATSVEVKLSVTNWCRTVSALASSPASLPLAVHCPAFTCVRSKVN